MSAQIGIETYDSDRTDTAAEDVRALYAEVYAEPPYCEGDEDIERFMRRFVSHQRQARFRLVLARGDGAAIGFAYGYGLRSTTGWWSGMVTDLPPEAIMETGSRTFAVLELAVRRSWRRRHVGQALHDALLAGRPEERAVLMVHPDADAAKAAYARWGWRPIGRARPWRGAPLYDALMLALIPGCQ